MPKIEHLGVFMRLLSRSALGSPITRQVIDERHQLRFVKQKAMQVAANVLWNPELPAAVETAGAGVEQLSLLMYNRLNAWGRQREVPAAPKFTFRQRRFKNGEGRRKNR